ncbi:MAG: lipopolysaccharide kinase InaA family protein [Candidatus Brocadiales bacterium]
MQKILRKNTGRITWYIPESEEQTLGDGLVNFTDPLLEETTTIHKRGRRKVFASLGTTVNGEELYLKAFRLTSLSLKLKHLFFRSKAMRELMIGLTALERGVPAIVPLAAGEKRRMGLIEESYIVLKKIGGAVDLSDYLNREDIPQHRRAKVIEALGRLARKSHESGVFQTDFSLNNFLLKDPHDPASAIYLIDFERTYIHDYLSEDMRNWALAKLNRVGANFSITDKMRFLKAYSVGKGMEKASLSSWMKELDKHTYWILRKDALRIHNASVRGDRGYKLYTNGSLRAYFLEGHNAEELMHLAKDPDNKGEAVETPGPFKLYMLRGRKYTKDVGVEVDVYRFIPHRLQSVDTRPSMEAWQTANALIKANIPVSPVIGVVESGEGSSYQGFIITKCIPGLRELRTVIDESPLCSERRQVLLWHAARFLSRLHNHGTFSSPIRVGDIGIQESPKGRIRLYLTRPFKFTMTLTMNGTRQEDRDSDLNSLEAFLGDLMGEKDVEFLRRLYRLHSSNIPSHGETLCSYTPGRWSMFRFP